MNDQVSIFDIIPDDPKDYPDWHNLTIEQIAAFIGEKIGVKFEPDTRWPEPRRIFKAVNKETKEEYSVHLSEYRCTDKEGQPFISVSYMHGKLLGGSNGPCDSLEDAVKFLRSSEKNWRKQYDETLKIKAAQKIINSPESRAVQGIIKELELDLSPYIVVVDHQTNRFVLYDDDHDQYIYPPKDVLDEVEQLRYDAEGKETEDGIAAASRRLSEIVATEPEWLNTAIGFDDMWEVTDEPEPEPEPEADPFYDGYDEEEPEI